LESLFPTRVVEIKHVFLPLTNIWCCFLQMVLKYLDKK
jgi:hypothetical protein